jgi:chromosome segregation ATPase
MPSPVRVRPPGVDELLQDYLRIINDKDTEILDLVARVQALETEQRKTEERAKTRIRALKESAGELQVDAEAAVRRLADAEGIVASLQRERDELRSDVETLRDAMYRQDNDLRAALRASEKAQKENGAAVQELSMELDARKREAADAAGALEHRLQATTRAMRESDDERTRLIKECAALQSRLEDRENQLREHKRQRKGLVPREDVTNEVRAVEARCNAEVTAAVRELERVRAEYTEEVHRAQRRDAALGEAREEARRVESQLHDARRVAQEAEMRAAQSQVAHAQRAEEMRADLALAHDKIAALESVRSGLDQERVTLQLRLDETKRAQQHSEVQLRTELERLRDRAIEGNAEIESLKRVAQQQDAMLAQARERADRIAEERAGEVRQLRDDVHRFSAAAQQSATAASTNEKVIVQMRDELRAEHDARLAAEKAVRELDSQLNRVRHQHDVGAAELASSANTIAELRREREEAGLRAARAEGAFRDLQEDAHKQRIELERATSEGHRLEAAAASERAERNRLEGRSNADQLTIKRLENELGDRDARLASLQSTYTTVDAQLAAARDEVNRLRTALDQATSDARRDAANDRDTIRRLHNEVEDVAHRLSLNELSRDELAKQVAALTSKEAQLASLLQSRAHELSAATERADGAEKLRQAGERQNLALQRQAAELQARVDELRASYDNLQACFDKQQEQLTATMRAREHEASILSQRAAAGANAGGSALGTSMSSAGAALGSVTPGQHMGGSMTAAASPARTPGLGLDNASALPARGPSLYTTSSRGTGAGPFSPGMYTSVLAGSSPVGVSGISAAAAAAASASSIHPRSSAYFGSAAAATHSMHLSPSRRGQSATSPAPRGAF